MLTHVDNALFGKSDIVPSMRGAQIIRVDAIAYRSRLIFAEIKACSLFPLRVGPHAKVPSAVAVVWGVGGTVVE